MTSKIPRISGNVMIKYLIKKGFVITSRAGSHVVLKGHGAHTSVPAGNRTMKIGLQLGILGDAGIDREAFAADYAGRVVR